MNPPVPKVQVQNDLLKYKADLKAHTQRFEERLEERLEEHIDAYEKESKTAKALTGKLETDVRRLEREGRELKERVDRVSHL